MNGKQCYNCGAFNAMTNQICCNCGANLVQPQAPQQNFGQPMYNQQPMANGFYPQPQKKSNTGLIIALSIIGVFAFFIIIGLIFGSDASAIEGNVYTKVDTTSTTVTTSEIHFQEDGKGYAKVTAVAKSGYTSPISQTKYFTYRVSGDNVTIDFESNKGVKYKIDGNCVYNVSNNIRYCK